MDKEKNEIFFVGDSRTVARMLRYKRAIVLFIDGAVVVQLTAHSFGVVDIMGSNSYNPRVTESVHSQVKNRRPD